MGSISAPDKTWWKNGTVYQIYPASYKDSNGDGWGDIPGAISTLDYLHDLGVDIIWLSPMYDSPQKDMGYDISNYEAVYPPFGTLEDMEVLIRECHARGMRLILDLVINHTSDQHAWFKESRKSKDNEKAEWYIWKNPKYVNGKRQEPNNWRSFFGGSAWEYVPERDQYYLHLFVTEQPDLNWENPVTRKAIYDSAVEFWLKRGVDGFRVDAVNLYSKNVEYPDAEVTDPSQRYQNAWDHFFNGPRIHEYLKEMNRNVLQKYGDVMTVGEGGAELEELLKYISADSKELSMTFDGALHMIGGRGLPAKHEAKNPTPPEIQHALKKTQGLINGTDAWTTVFSENHDQGRSIPTFATDDSQYREKAGKLLAMLWGTLSGTLFVYQGQEIGMTNVPKSWGIEEFKDIDTINYWREMKEKYGDDKDMLRMVMLDGIQKHGRDNARTPMQWDSSANAGFTSGKPWIRVNDNYPEINVKAQLEDPDSVYTFWKTILQLRRQYADAMIHGQFEGHDPENKAVLAYIKSYESKKVLVVLNWTDGDQPIDLPPAFEAQSLELLIANEKDLKEKLGPWEGRVYLLR